MTILGYWNQEINCPRGVRVIKISLKLTRREGECEIDWKVRWFKGCLGRA